MMANLLMVLSWGLFYALHTLLAASKLKRILEARWPGVYNWYRLFYTLLATVLFLGLLIQALFLPKTLVFLPGQFGEYAGYMIATAGVMIVLKSVKEIRLGSFLGVKKPEKEESDQPLVATGWYAQVRHPLYLGLLLIFSGYFLVSGTQGALIHLACLIVYLPIGIYFEEKNLIATYGDEYRIYRREVPAFFPKLIKKRA
jgi:protein-S-isoprenylcysteine O-methyltransferase Ste14